MMRILKKLLLCTSFAAALLGGPVLSAHAEPSIDPSLLPELKTDNPAITNIDVLIDVGHGGVDGGTTHGSIMEKDINLAIAQKTYEALRRKGLVVVMNRMDDYALSGENLWLKTRSRHIKDLAQRSHLANEVKPKALISLHVNSSRSARERGALLLHQKNERSKALAKSIQDCLNSLYSGQNKPVYGRTYYLLKHIQSPAVIVEMGFLTNPQDRAFLLSEKGQEAIAEQIAEGVAAYLKKG